MSLSSRPSCQRSEASSDPARGVRFNAVSHHLACSPEEVLDRLRERGLRITADRRAVVEALVQATHVSAEELIDTVQRRHPDVHASTVYRTLETLEVEGLASHVHLGHGPARWHLGGERHVHLSCDVCGSVTDIDEAVLSTLRRTVKRQAGFDLDGRHFALVGRCDACQHQGVTAQPVASRP